MKMSWILMLITILAVVGATPPGIANNPSHASCKKKEYKECHNLVHVCPKFCPDSCHVHCASCKPICGPEPPEETSPTPATPSPPPTPVTPPPTPVSPPPTLVSPPPTPVSPPPTPVSPPPTPVSPPPTLVSPPPTPVSPPPTLVPPPPTPVSPPPTPVSPPPTLVSPPPTPITPPPTLVSPPPTPVSPPPTPVPPPTPTTPVSPPPTPATPSPPPTPETPPPTLEMPSPPPTPVSPPPTPVSPPPTPATPSPPPTPETPPPTPEMPSPPPTPVSPPLITPVTPPSPPPTPVITPPAPETPSSPPPFYPPSPLTTPPPPSSDVQPPTTPTAATPPQTNSPPTPSLPPSNTPSPTPPTTTPPSSLSPPDYTDEGAGRRKRCRSRDYPQCYGVQHVCPSSCPYTCEVDCVTCRPVCSCDRPGAVCQDPRFIGGDGITFYFHGKKDKNFCLVTDPNLHINAHFIGKRNENMKRDFTWVQSIGILFGSHRFFLGAQKTATWDSSTDRLTLSFDGEPIVLPTKEGATWQVQILSSIVVKRDANTNSITIEVDGLFKISAKVVPITKRESDVHNYGITNDDCFAHLELGFKFYSVSEKMDGVLGQTYRSGYVSRAKMGVAMPVLGGERAFKVSNLFATDCSVSKFEAGKMQLDSGSDLELPSIKCGSGIGGRGVVCKR